MEKETAESIMKLSRAGYGYKFIATQLNLPVSTVKSHIRRHKLQPLRDKCLNCGKVIQQAEHQKPKKFCCDACRMTWWSKHQDEIRHKDVHTVNCEYCGKEITVYGKKERKYCSTACFAKARLDAHQEELRASGKAPVSCGKGVQSLPAHCLCASCEWFRDGKRSCQNTETIDTDLQSRSGRTAIEKG